eukprot:gene11337-11425_t
MWLAALKKANITNFRFHDLRHSAASYLAMNGASLAEIAEVLGHKTLSMVKRYAHLSEAHTAKVVQPWAKTKGIKFHPVLEELVGCYALPNGSSDTVKQNTPTLRISAIYKEKVQVAAKILWEQNPNMTIEAIKKHRYIQEFAGDERFALDDLTLTVLPDLIPQLIEAGAENVDIAATMAKYPSHSSIHQYSAQVWEAIGFFPKLDNNYV